jgi:hypothetical protein
MALDLAAASFIVATSSDPIEVTSALDQLIALGAALPTPRIPLPSPWALHQLHAPLSTALYVIANCDDPTVLARFVARGLYESPLSASDDIFYAIAINPATSVVTQVALASRQTNASPRVQQALLERMHANVSVEVKFAELVEQLAKNSTYFPVTTLSFLKDMRSAGFTNALDDLLVQAIKVGNEAVPMYILHNRYLISQDDTTELYSNCSYATHEILSLMARPQAALLAQWLITRSRPEKDMRVEHVVPLDGPLTRVIVDLIPDPGEHPGDMYHNFANEPNGFIPKSWLTPDGIDVLIATPLWSHVLHISDLTDDQFSRLLETASDPRPLLLRMDNNFDRALPPKHYFSQLLSALSPDQTLHRTDWALPIQKVCSSQDDPLFHQLLDHATGFLIYNYLVCSLIVNNERVRPSIDELCSLVKKHCTPEHALLFPKAPATAKSNKALDDYVTALIEFVPGAAAAHIETSGAPILDETSYYISDRLQATGHALSYSLGQLFSHREASLHSMCNTLSILATAQ